ncbi:hypothetical protein HPB47_013402 [Ixodes persulcatus]|uniref:Uncharacterized protein n=1 Tax=Ixodes persulcatus TaxID=34615 RepID=A0AC60QYV1_IXOPE|nr:hypothetical protein HPB47_013402 [Ixodes persulcatus]
MAVRGFPVSGEKGILVVEPSPGGPAPRTESRATQFSLEDLAGPSQAPKQPAGKQGAPGTLWSSQAEGPPSQDAEPISREVQQPFPCSEALIFCRHLSCTIFSAHDAINAALII